MVRTLPNKDPGNIVVYFRKWFHDQVLMLRLQLFLGMTVQPDFAHGTPFRWCASCACVKGSMAYIFNARHGTRQRKAL